MDNVLVHGEIRTGLLGDMHNRDAVGASLTLGDHGPVVSIAHDGRSASSALVTQWLNRGGGYTDLLFRDDRGPVTLLNTRWAGQSGAGPFVTRGVASSAVCQAPKEASRPAASRIENEVGEQEYTVNRLASSIDGLLRFIGAPHIDVDDSRADQLIIQRGQHDVLSWTVTHDELEADLSFELRRTTPWHASYGQASVDQRAEVVVGYAFNEGDADALFIHVQPLRALLVLIYGQDAKWRTHQVNGPNYVQWVQRGDLKQRWHEPIQQWEPAFLEATAQWSTALPEDLGVPTVGAADFGEEGLRQWFARWATDDDFRTPMQPAIEALAGMTRFLEPRVISYVSALEGLGGWIQGTPREYMGTQKAVQACLDAIDADWSNFAETSLISGYLATIYNDLKHPQRGRRPDHRELRLAARLAKTLIQLVALWGIPLDRDAGQHFEAGLIDRLESDLGQWEFEAFTIPNPDPKKPTAKGSAGVQLVLPNATRDALLVKIIKSAQ